MMNKFIKKAFLCSTIVFIAFSCKENEEKLDRTYNHTEPAVLQQTTPENNGTLPLFAGSVGYTFDKPVTLVDFSKVTLSGGDVLNYTIAENSLSVSLGGLEENTKYTLTIPKSNLKGVPGILNEEDIVVNFTTGDAPEIIKTLATPNASSQAQNVYNYLRDNYRKNIISGIMANVAWNTDEADRVFALTKKYPALNGFDYIHHRSSTAGGWIDYDDISVIKKWWDNNGLVTIGWHWNVPKQEGSSDYAFYTSETSFDITKAVQDGTYENSIVKEDLETISGYLLKLQANNIPVIWRPLHEASGAWFWWGAKGSDAYKELWKIMFDTFKAKGINNLIWVWTTQTGDDSWYPGDAYVDIIGRDIYNDYDTKNLFNNEYWVIRKQYQNKIVALSECGSVSNISEQWNGLSKWSWFMPWYGKNDSGENHGSDDFWKEALDNKDFDKIITRDKVPDLK